MTTTTHQNQPTYISLGYRCSTAGILKRLGLKHESFPFDWMISRLPIIKDCIETRFAYFIDPKWYVKKQTHTTHYHKGTTPVPMKICDETIYENVHYANLYQDQTPLSYDGNPSPDHHRTPTFVPQFTYETPDVVSPGIAQFTYETPDVVSSGIPHSGVLPKTMNIPEPLSRENGDTYAHLLAMNHRNINDPETQAYYERCIDRFVYYWENPAPVVGIYIHPTITEKEYQDQSNDLQQEFREFYEKTMPKHWSAVFFIIVRTNHPYPITDHLPDFLQILYTDTLSYDGCPSPDNQQPPPNQTTLSYDGNPSPDHLDGVLKRHPDPPAVRLNHRTPTFVPHSGVLPNQIPSRNIRIYVVYTNCDFVDAGEIFMHNPYIEIDAIMRVGGTLVPP